MSIPDVRVGCLECTATTVSYHGELAALTHDPGCPRAERIRQALQATTEKEVTHE